MADSTHPCEGSEPSQGCQAVEVFETAETSRFRLLAGLVVIGLGVLAFLALTLPEVFPPGWLANIFGPVGPPDLPRRLLGLLAGILIVAVGVFLLAVARYTRGVRITVSAQGLEYLDRQAWIVAAWPEVYSLAEQATPDGGKAYTVATAHGDFRFQTPTPALPRQQGRETLPAADRLAALIRRRIGEDSHD